MKHTTQRIFLIVFSLFCLPIQLFAQGGDGTWATLSSAGFTARKGMASAVVQGKIYTICGIGNNGSTNTFVNKFEVFDPSSNSWNTPKTTSAPTARYLVTAAVFNNKIYVIGGTDGIDVMPLEIFDPSTNIWTKQKTTGQFTQRDGLTASVVGDKIYVIGGENNSGPLATLEVFDPATNVWSTPTTTGTFLPASKLTSSVVGDKIYVMGGYDGSSDLNTLTVFDPATNVWSTPTTTGTFTPRDNLTSAVLDGKIYVLGGFSDGQALNTVEVFDTATNTWSTPAIGGTFTARSELSSSVVNDEIYVIGGVDGSIKNTNEVYRPVGSGVDSKSKNAEISLSPNPTTGIVAIHNPETALHQITVTNILGEKMMELANPNSSEFTLDISKLPPGVYGVNFISEHGLMTKMVVKE